jgi:hypothetical protein
MLFKGIINILSGNHRKHKYTLWPNCKAFHVKSGGTQSNHCVLRVKAVIRYRDNGIALEALILYSICFQPDRSLITLINHKKIKFHNFISAFMATITNIQMQRQINKAAAFLACAL